MCEGFISAMRGNYGIDLDFTAHTRARVYTAIKAIYGATKKVRYPASVVEPHCILVVNPL